MEIYGVSHSTPFSGIGDRGLHISKNLAIPCTGHLNGWLDLFGNVVFVVYY